MTAEPQKAPKRGVTPQSLSVDKEQVQRVPCLLGQGPRRLFALRSSVLPADVPNFFGSTCRASYLLAMATWEAGAVPEETWRLNWAGTKGSVCTAESLYLYRGISRSEVTIC